MVRMSLLLLEIITLIVIKRNTIMHGPKTEIPQYAKILYASNPVIDISSTDIRQMIKDSKTVRFLLPDPVINYIHEKGLYQR